MFTHGRNIECPECPLGKRGRKPKLVVAERNYSGCSVDYGYCEECGKAWCISYKVDTMTRAPEWDAPSREQVEEEERLKRQREKLNATVKFEFADGTSQEVINQFMNDFKEEVEKAGGKIL